MNKEYIAGQTIQARGRPWTVVIPNEDDIDMLIADPHLKDEEISQVQRIEKVNEAKRTSIPTGINLQRSALDLSEIES